MNFLVIATLVAVAYSLPTSLESNKDHSSEASSLEAKKLENFESQSFEKVSIEVNSEEITEDNAFSPNIKESSPDHKSPTHPTLLSSNIQSESDEISKERNSLETENSDEEGFLPKSFIDGVNAIRELLERLEKLATAFISKKSRDHTEDEKIDNIPLDSKESVEVGSFDKYAKEFEGLKEQDLSQEIISKELDSTEDSKEKILSKEIISKELDLTLESKEQALSTETISKELSSTEESKEEVLSKETISKELNSTEEKSKPSLPNPPSGEKRKVFRSFQVSTDFDSAGKDNNSNQRDKDFSDEESSEKSELVELLNDKENPSSHSIEVFVDAESENSQETSTNKSPELHIFQSSSEEKVEIITSSKIIKKLFGIIDDTNLVLKEDERLGNKYLLDYSVENISNEDSVEKISVEKISADDSFEKIDFTDISKENDSEDLSVEKNNLSNIYIASNEEFILQSSDLNNPSVQLELEFQTEEDSKEQDEQINVSISKELISQETLNSKEVTDKTTKSSESFELELQTEDNSKEQDEQINISISKELISQETLISKEVSDKTTKSSESFELLLKDIMNKVKQNKTSTTDSFENISGFHNEDVSLEAEKEIEFVAIIPFKSEFEPTIGVQAASESVKFNQGYLHSVGKLPHSIRGPGITLSEANRAVESLLTVSQRRKLSQKPLLLETPQTSENNRHFGVPLEESNKATEQNLLKSSSNFLAQYNIVDTSGLPLNANILKPVGSADGEQLKLNNLQTEIVTENLATTKLISNNPVQWGIPLEKANTEVKKNFETLEKEVRLQVSKIPYYIRGYGKSLSEANKALKESGIENRNNIQQSDVNSNVAPSSDLQVKEVHSQPSSLAKSANSLKTQGPSSEKLSQSGISLDAANAAVDNQFKSLVFRAQKQSKHSQYQVRGFGKTLEEANTAFRASHDTSSKSNILPNLSEDPRRNFKVLSKSETSSIAINSDNSSEFLEVESSPEVADSNASSNIKIPVLSQNNGVPLSSANKAVEEKFESLVKIAQHIPKNSQFHVKGFGKPLIEVNTALESSTSVVESKHLSNIQGSSIISEHGVPLATITPQEEIETKITSALGHIPISSINDGLSLSSANAATAENLEKFAKIIDEQPKNSPNHVKGFGKSLDSANRGQETSTQAKNKSFSNILDSSKDSEHGVQLVAVSPQEEIETGIHSSSTHHNNIPSNIGLPLNTAILAEENFESPKEDPQSKAPKSHHKTTGFGKSLDDANRANEASSTVVEIENFSNSQNFKENVHGKSLVDLNAALANSAIEVESTDSSTLLEQGVQLGTVSPQEIETETSISTFVGLPLNSEIITEENFESPLQDSQNKAPKSQKPQILTDGVQLTSTGVDDNDLTNNADSSVISTHGVQLVTITPQEEMEITVTNSEANIPLSSATITEENFKSIINFPQNQPQDSQLSANTPGKSLEDLNTALENLSSGVENTKLSHSSNSSVILTHGVQLAPVAPIQEIESETSTSTPHIHIDPSNSGLPLKFVVVIPEVFENLGKVANNHNQTSQFQSDGFGEPLKDVNSTVDNFAIETTSQDLDSSFTSQHGVPLTTVIDQNGNESEVISSTTINPISSALGGLPLKSTNLLKNHLNSFVNNNNQNPSQNSEPPLNESGKSLDDANRSVENSAIKESLKDSLLKADSFKVSNTGDELSIFLSENNDTTQNPISKDIFESEIPLEATTSGFGLNLEELALTLNKNEVNSLKTFDELFSTTVSPEFIEREVSLEPANIAGGGIELPTNIPQKEKETENLSVFITGSPVVVEGLVNGGISLDSKSSPEDISSINTNKKTLSGNENPITVSSSTGVELPTIGTQNKKQVENLDDIITESPSLVEGFAGSDTLLDAINSPDIKSSIGVSKIVDNDALTKSKLSGVSLTEANTAVHQNFESLKIGAQNIQKKIPFHIKGLGKSLDEANNELLRTQEKSQSNLPSTKPNVSQLFSNGFELEEISSIAESPENEASASHIKHTITSIKFPETGVPLDRKSTDKVHIGKVRIHSESEKHKLNKQIKGRGKSIESANRASQTLHKPGRKVLVNKKIKLRPATNVLNNSSSDQSPKIGVPLLEANSAVEEIYESLLKMVQNHQRSSQYQVKGFGKSLENANKETEETIKKLSSSISLQNSDSFSPLDDKIQHEIVPQFTHQSLPVSKTSGHEANKNGSPLENSQSHTLRIHKIQSESLELKSSEEKNSNEEDRHGLKVEETQTKLDKVNRFNLNDDVYDDVYDIIEELLEEQEEIHSKELSKESINDTLEEFDSKEFDSVEAERITPSQLEKAIVTLKTDVSSAKVLENSSEEDIPSLEIISKEIVDKTVLNLDYDSKSVEETELQSKEDQLVILQDTISGGDTSHVKKELILSLDKEISSTEDLKISAEISVENESKEKESIIDNNSKSAEEIDLKSIEKDISSIEDFVISNEEKEIPSFEDVSIEILNNNLTIVDSDSKSIENHESIEQDHITFPHEVISGKELSHLRGGLSSIELFSSEDLENSAEKLDKDSLEETSLEVVGEHVIKSLDVSSREKLRKELLINFEKEISTEDFGNSSETLEVHSIEIVSKEVVDSLEHDSKSAEDILETKDQSLTVFLQGNFEKEISTEDFGNSSETLEVHSVEIVSKKVVDSFEHDDKSIEDILETKDQSLTVSLQGNFEKDISAEDFGNSSETLEVHSVEVVSKEVVDSLEHDSKSAEDILETKDQSLTVSLQGNFEKEISTEDFGNSSETLEVHSVEIVSKEVVDSFEQDDKSIEDILETKDQSLTVSLQGNFEKDISAEDFGNSSETLEVHSVEVVSKEVVDSLEHDSKSVEDILETKDQSLAASLQGILPESSTSQPKKNLVTIIQMKALSAEDFKDSSEKILSIERVSKETLDENVSTLDFNSKSTEDADLDSKEKDQAIILHDISSSSAPQVKGEITADHQKEVLLSKGLDISSERLEKSSLEILKGVLAENEKLLDLDNESVEDIDLDSKEDEIITSQHGQENPPQGGKELSSIHQKEQLSIEDLGTSSEKAEVHSLENISKEEHTSTEKDDVESKEQDVYTENISHGKKDKTNLQTLSERLELSIKDKSDEDGIHSIETDLKENKNSTSDEKVDTSAESVISKEDADDDDDDTLEEKNIDHLRNYFYPERGYVFEYTSDDGTRRKELAKKEEDTGLLEKEGEVSFTFPTGEDYKLTYTAGKEGYKPSSSWLPVAPVFPHPIPAFVLRQIEEAKRKAEENGSSEERSQQALRKAFNLS